MDFSHSQLQAYLTCNKLHLHMYLRRMRLRKRPTYYVLGEAVHKFIEMFYRSQDVKLSKRQVENVYNGLDRSLLTAEEIHKLECDKQIALGISEAYPRFYKQDFDTYKKFLTEQKFKFPLDEKYSEHYTGYIDVLAQDHAGDWWIMETKTASQLDADYFERVKIDSQVSGYMHGAKSILGFFPRGVVYNVIKKPAIRLKAGESFAAFQKRIFLEYDKLAKEKGYFTREELMIGDIQLKRWLSNTVSLVAVLANKIRMKTKTWIMNTGACQSKYGTCPYLQACVSGNYNELRYVKEERK